jgi:hypothetical protein
MHCPPFYNVRIACAALILSSFSSLTMASDADNFSQEECQSLQSVDFSSVQDAPGKILTAKVILGEGDLADY